MNKTMASTMTKEEYKEYFEQNNLKGNNYETAKFIKFLMDKKVKGREMEELIGIKHSQITSYKKIINSGKMEDLKNKSISKVFKSIDSGSTKLDKRVISEFEKSSDKIPDKFMFGEDSDGELYDSDSDYDEQIAWEEEVRRITLEKSKGYTDNADYLITELVDENKILRRRALEATRTVEEQQMTIKEITSENDNLRRENASLLKFFEEMKGRMDSFQN